MPDTEDRRSEELGKKAVKKQLRVSCGRWIWDPRELLSELGVKR